VSLSYFYILQFGLNLWPSVLSQLIQAQVSVSRINGFLRLAELNPHNVLPIKKRPYAADADADATDTSPKVEAMIRQTLNG
jgi:hypothetical protein